MKSTHTGRLVTNTLRHDDPVPADVIAQLSALKGRPVDLGDLPEQHIDETWIMPGAGNALGLMLAGHQGCDGFLEKQESPQMA